MNCRRSKLGIEIEGMTGTERGEGMRRRSILITEMEGGASSILATAEEVVR